MTEAEDGEGELEDSRKRSWGGGKAHEAFGRGSKRGDAARGADSGSEVGKRDGGASSRVTKGSGEEGTGGLEGWGAGSTIEMCTSASNTSASDLGKCVPQVFSNVACPVLLQRGERVQMSDRWGTRYPGGRRRGMDLLLVR